MSQDVKLITYLLAFSNYHATYLFDHRALSLPPEIPIDEIDNLILGQCPLNALDFSAHIPAVKPYQSGQSTH